MILPRDLLTGGYKKPNIFLCEVDKERICQLNTTNTNGVLKFNSYSEISFEVGRTYVDYLTGEKKVNPYYAKIEAIRLVEIENLGYFEIQGPELTGNGIEEKKQITAYSLEYTLSQKYLEDFIINMGTIGSVEVTYAEDVTGDINKIKPVTLYNPSTPKLSLLHLALEPIYGWTIGYVDPSLKTLTRQFEIDRESVYDFLMNDVCEKFNCYIVFDTINNTINVYAESLTSKFIGDGSTNTFVISPPFSQIGTVSVDGYKTTRWTYNHNTGTIVLEDTPESGARIEVVDGALTAWETDVFVTFDNLCQEVSVNYDADAIKTKLTVTYGDNGDIRDVNLGLPYLTDLSYYYTVDWMGQDLYDAYTKYIQKSNILQIRYTDNAQEILQFNDKIYYEENRLSLEYSLVASVSSTTVGTYYTRVENSDGSFYYKEVSLPGDYNANDKYYSNATTNVNEDKISKLFGALKKYFNNENEDKSSDGANITSWKTELNSLASDFEFMTTFSLSYLTTWLEKVTKNRTRDNSVKTAINNFLSEVWAELGRTPLKRLYLEPYETVKATNIEAGWSSTTNPNYAYYYPVLLMISSIEEAIAKRTAFIEAYEKQRNVLYSNNAAISNELVMDNNFTNSQLIKLNAFLREDELQIQDIVETSQDNLSSSFRVKQDAKEAGRIELQKLCQPQLQFSMSMANIYALPEFAPIVHQFQLGRVIKVGLRPDYIKQSRLLQVDINFDDFSDFSCEFGELTNLRTQSDIHADLLKNAISAGKSVATSSSYWSRGSDVATAIDLKIQQGLLDATTKIKATDGSQGVVIDKYGIWLTKTNPDGSTSPYQTRIVNNMILMSDDSFQTSRSALGEIVVDGETYYGLIAEMVLSGIVESSKIIGGTIQIGEQVDENGNTIYAFEVHEDGSVTMNGGSTIAGYAKEEDVEQLRDSAPIVSNTQPEHATEGQIWLNTDTAPYTLMIFNNGEWVYFNQQNGGMVFTSTPTSYKKGDLWVVAEDEKCEYEKEEIIELEDGTTTSSTVTYVFGPGVMLKAIESSEEFINEHWVDVDVEMSEVKNNITQYFSFDKNTGLTIGQQNEDFYVNISSKEMGFYDNTEDDNRKVVNISNKSANILNLNVDGGAKFDCDTEVNANLNVNGSLQIESSFSWQLEEDDGSLSLMVIKSAANNVATTGDTM